MKKRIPVLQVFCMLVIYDRCSATQMAEQIGCSTRSVYRIVEDLELAGVPIYRHRGQNGGFEILKAGHNISQMYKDIIGVDE